MEYDFAIFRFEKKMAFAKFQENQFRIDGEIAENHAILVNLTASIGLPITRRPSLGYSLSDGGGWSKM